LLVRDPWKSLASLFKIQCFQTQRNFWIFFLLSLCISLISLISHYFFCYHVRNNYIVNPLFLSTFQLQNTIISTMDSPQYTISFHSGLGHQIYFSTKGIKVKLFIISLKKKMSFVWFSNRTKSWSESKSNRIRQPPREEKYIFKLTMSSSE